jgi:uncharacterized membrane protein
MPDSAPQLEPWDRQAGEPNLWYARFERYRLAGPSRSLLGTVNAEKGQKGTKRQDWIPGAWSRAAGCWRWRERAEAWDEQERHKARVAHALDVEEMNRRHVQEAQALQNKALLRLKSLDVDNLSAADVLRYLVEATKLERSARGEPETILGLDAHANVKHSGDRDNPVRIKVEGPEPNLDGLSVTDLETLLELRRKAIPAGVPPSANGNAVAHSG